MSRFPEMGGSHAPDRPAILGRPGDSRRRPPTSYFSLDSSGPSYTVTETNSRILVANGVTPGFVPDSRSGLLQPLPSLMHGPERPVNSNPRENLRRYQSPGERIDLNIETNAELRDLIEGIGRFKSYNVHEQVTSDRDSGALALGPGEFRVPNKNRFHFLFLHDSYYMAKPDTETPEGRQLIESALDKFCDLYDQYGMIPNFAATPSLNASALPLLIPMAWEWYQQHPDKKSEVVRKKMKQYMETGADEHEHVWNNSRDLTGAIGSYHHMFSADSRLRRTGDRDAGYATNAGREWFWDFSSVRGAGSENRLAPICLNSILAQNEDILSQAATELGIDRLGNRTADEWHDSAVEMRTEINMRNYDPRTKTYHDYDYVSQQRRRETTLAAVWAIWGGVATGEQALDVVGQLAELDSGHGLLVTSPEDLQKPIPDAAFRELGLAERFLPAVHTLTEPGNWDGNVWPPLLITAKEAILKYATEDYGLSPHQRLQLVRFGIVQTQNEIRTQSKIFHERGIFPEKWCADGHPDDSSYHYERQNDGIGWSAASAELNIRRFLPQLYALEDALTAQLKPTAGQPHNVFRLLS